MKHALASEAVKQGYIALTTDEKGNEVYRRTEDHRIMEMFDFVVTIGPKPESKL